jgi:hypothetical protein
MKFISFFKYFGRNKNLGLFDSDDCSAVGWIACAKRENIYTCFIVIGRVMYLLFDKTHKRQRANALVRVFYCLFLNVKIF